LNKNNLLESNETWSFTCQTNITQTTTNTGVAQGNANGLTAIDASLATVVVAAPALPNTGLGEQGISFGVVASGLVIAALGYFYFLRRKQTA
jgi:LPXTG-motif cell wall-anchored protein